MSAASLRRGTTVLIRVPSSIRSDCAAVWDYEAQPKETVAACNLCDSRALVLAEYPDRYGFDVVTADCLRCGLSFLAERMTREAYARFYATGYRPLVSAFHGREISAQTIQPEQREYGRRLADMLEPWVPKGALTLLDVGGSTGVVARTVGARLALQPTVLDPSPEELAEAGAGLEAIAGFVEDFEPAGRTWEVVTLCQTIDHLLDPMAALRKIHALLAPGGVFWVDILDFDRTRTVKIDHPYNFTPRTMGAYLDRVGFKVLQTNRDGDHVGYVCRRAA